MSTTTHPIIHILHAYIYANTFIHSQTYIYSYINHSFIRACNQIIHIQMRTLIHTHSYIHIHTCMVWRLLKIYENFNPIGRVLNALKSHLECLREGENLYIAICGINNHLKTVPK